MKDLIAKRERREKALQRRKRNEQPVSKEMTTSSNEYVLPSDFEDKVLNEVFALSDDITSELIRRRDMRSVLTFTIDPEDAKDFDDAISFHVLNEDIYQIGIHIADVTHYVREDSLTNEEAYNRGTSVYLVDRVIPMLPERLSNEVCSLRPNEDKLCMSVIVEMDNNAKVLRHKICRTVICSNYRLDYAGAQTIMDDTNRQDELALALRMLHELADVLRQDRFRHGAINFEHEEVRFRLDADGNPTDIYFHPILDTNHLIEEFMLLANRLVATDIGKMKLPPKPMVYRVHDHPDPDKMGKLSTFVRRFGLNVRTDKKGATIKQINQLLDTCRGMSCQNLVETLTIRAMAKAVYSTDNIGHYGLCFPYYTHFTSPIRRYPDMMVHRLVSRYILGERKTEIPEKDELESCCQHCSDREQGAQMAERDSIKQMQTQWMSNHIGETFDGIISGVTEYGLYVQLTNTLTEGLVPIRTLCPGDYMQWDPDNYSLVALRSGITYTLSDEVKVTVTRADVEKRQIDFRIVGEDGDLS